MKYLKDIAKRIAKILAIVFVLTIGAIEFLLMFPSYAIVYIFSGKEINFMPTTKYIDSKLEDLWV